MPVVGKKPWGWIAGKALRPVSTGTRGVKKRMAVTVESFIPHAQEITVITFTHHSFCREVPSSAQPDIRATYDAGTYTPVALTSFQVPLRVVLYKDRIIPVEKKFFCEEATEKTVSLLVSLFHFCVLGPFFDVLYLPGL